MADEAPKPGGCTGTITKLITTLFCAIVAPLTVAVSVKYLAPKDENRPPTVVEAKSADKDKEKDRDKVEPPEKDRTAKDKVPLEKDKADKDKADKDKADKDKADKDKATRDKIDKDRADKDKADKDKFIRDKSFMGPAKHLVDADLTRSWLVYEKLTDKPPDDKKLSKDLKGVASGIGGDKAAKESMALHYQRVKDKDVGAAPIFRYADAALQSPGTRLGALVSKNTYENYHLVVEYKWLPAAETKKARRAGIVLHAQDDGKLTWMPGVTCLIRPADTGSLQLRGEPGKVSAMATVVEKDVAKETKKGMLTLRREYRPDASAKLVNSGTKSWAGIVHRLGNTTSHADDEDTSSGKDDVEKDGEWNRIECTCDGDTIAVRLNGKDVNALTALNRQKGQIIVLAEGSALSFRRIDVHQLKK